MRSLAMFCLFAGATVELPSQTTHLVGPGGLPQIRDALAVASPGDTILVQPGTYAQFTATVAVTIRATTPGTVTIALDPAVLPPGCANDLQCAATAGATYFALPAGSTAHVVGLDFAPTVWISGNAMRHQVVVSGGRVTFDRCSLAAQETTALAVSGAAAHLQHCTVGNLGGNGFALYASSQSHVTATGTTFTGGTALLSPNHDAVNLLQTRFVGSGLVLQGGSATIGGPGRALYASNSDVWIADSSLTANGCPVVASFSTGRIDRSSLSPATGCAGLGNGPVVGVELLTTLTNGQPLAMRVRTEPNVLVAIHASNSLGTTWVPALLEQPLALDPTAFFLAGVFVSDGNGEVTGAWNLPPGQFVNTPLWLEAIAFLPALPIQVGPVVGGVID